MKKFIINTSFILLLLFALSLFGCSNNNGNDESYVELEGTEYTSTVNKQGPVLVVADDDQGSVTYTSPGSDIDFGSLSRADAEGEKVNPPVFDVTISTKTQTVGECVVDGDKYSLDCSKHLMSITIEGNDREAFIEYAKKDCEKAFEQEEISKKEKEQYMALLDGKIIDVYTDSKEKLVVSGTIDSTNNTMTMESLTQYDSDGDLWQISKYNSAGVIVHRERYNKAGVVVGVFEKYDDGQQKSITWYNDDGSFMNSEEYIVENGVKIKAIFKAEDGTVGTEYYKNGLISRFEEVYSSGIQTWAEYNEEGKTVKYKTVTGGNDDQYNMGLFILNPITDEYIELESTVYSNDGSIINNTVCTYDDNYILTKVSSYDSNGKLDTEEKFDKQGRPIYWYSIYDKVYIITKYDGEDYDCYFETYDLDGTLKQIATEKDGKTYVKSLLPNGTWREEVLGN